MQRSPRGGISRMVSVAIVIVVIVVAVGVGAVLSTRTSTSSTTTPSSSMTSSSSSTTSTSATSTRSSSSSTTSSTTSSTSSSTALPAGCVFGSPPPVVAKNTTLVPQFMGCLVSNATGIFQIAVADPNGVVMQGAVRSQYPAEFTLSGAAVDNMTAAGNGATALTANDTTVLPLDNLSLFPSKGYQFTVVNESGQNNTVTFLITLVDLNAFEGG